MPAPVNTELNLFDFEFINNYFYLPNTIFINKNKIKYQSSKVLSYSIDRFLIEHRFSHETPKKIGQFASIWKRDTSAKTAPFSINDPLDFLIISLKDENNMGQFIFPKKLLIEKGIIETKDKKGKMGMRLYPPWVKPNNKQAINSQKWQILFFYDFNNDNSIREMKNIFEI